MKNMKMNPALIMVLGSAVMVGATATLKNALAAAFASAVTLIVSGLLVSILKKFITEDMEVFGNLIVIAGVATAALMLTNCLFPAAYKSINVSLSTLSTSLLAYVVCKNVKEDGVGVAVTTALYFAVCLLCMGALRELISLGSIYGTSIGFLSDYTITMFGNVPGGLILFGLLLACTNKEGYSLNLEEVLGKKGE